MCEIEKNLPLLTIEASPFSPINVYDKTKLSEQGEFCQLSNGTLVKTQYTTNYHHTDYIEVTPNVMYIRKFQFSFVFFDQNKTFISSVETPSTTSVNGISGFGVKTPPNCKYIIINVLTTSKDLEFLYMAEENPNAPTNYTLRMPKLDLYSRVEKLETASKPLSGKKIVCFGDSITEFGNYPEVIANLTGATTYNVGFGGCKMTNHPDVDYNKFSMTQLVKAITTKDFSGQDTANANLIAKGDDNSANLNRLKSIDFNQVDYITIFYGTNDYGGNTYPGEETEPVTEPYLIAVRPALKHIIRTIQTTYPKLKIYFVTPIYRYYPSEGNIDTSIRLNNRSLLLTDYNNIIIEYAKRYSLPVLDLYKTSGINEFTRGTYISSDGTHPVQEGYNLIGEKIAKFLLSY